MAKNGLFCKFPSFFFSSNLSSCRERILCRTNKAAKLAVRCALWPWESYSVHSCIKKNTCLRPKKVSRYLRKCQWQRRKKTFSHPPVLWLIADVLLLPKSSKMKKSSTIGFWLKFVLTYLAEDSRSRIHQIQQKPKSMFVFLKFFCFLACAVKCWYIGRM